MSNGEANASNQLVRFVSGHSVTSDGKLELHYEDRPYEEMDVWANRVLDEASFPYPVTILPPVKVIVPNE